ncbi:hypothetical protein [Leuconostoc citreum]|uniref:hypothetical protein n=1 Tax=Leuconostoc citreum TaxID=33964 RepID=UPI0032DE4E6E
MSLFRKDYNAERAFRLKSYIRLRGRAWFLWLYALIGSILVLIGTIYATILFDLIIRVGGSYVQTIGFYIQTKVMQLPNVDTIQQMAATVFLPSQALSIFSRLTLVTGAFFVLVFLRCDYRWVIKVTYDWFQE